MIDKNDAKFMGKLLSNLGVNLEVKNRYALIVT